MEEESIFRQMATVIKTSNGDRKIPIVTSKGEAVWMDEEQQYSLSDDTFGQASLSAYKLGTAIKISEELLNDSVFDLPSYIAKEFARRIGSKEEEAFFIGDGKGKPTGIFNATGGAEDGTSTSTANITFDDVMELFYSLRSPYRKKAVWVLNDSTVKALRKLKDNTGNSFGVRLCRLVFRIPFSIVLTRHPAMCRKSKQAISAWHSVTLVITGWLTDRDALSRD